MSKRATAWAPLFLLACGLAYLLPGYAYTIWATPRTQVPAEDTAASSTPESLAYYVGAQRLDPIFAIEGTDPPALRTALASFFYQRDRVSRLYTPEQSRAIVASLYPNEFLLLLPDLEAARQALLAEPSAARAKKYHSLLVEAISEYAVGARAVAGMLEAAGATFGNLGYIGGTATTSDIATKLKKVASLALRQKQKEIARWGCLEQLSAQCPSLASLEEERDLALNAAPEVLPSPPADAYKADALLRQILPLLSTFKYASQAVYAIPSDCFLEPVAYLRASYSEWVPGKMARKHSIINDLYFYDVLKEAQKTPDRAVLKEYARAGVALQYQNIGNQYLCPNSGLDTSSVGSIVGVLESMAESPRLAEERRLLGLAVVQKSDIAPYVRMKAQEHTQEGDALAQVYLQGSAGFNEVVMGLYSDNHFLTTWDKAKDPVRYEYILATRTYASTLFLMGNPTFVPEKISLFSTAVQSPLSGMYLRGYLRDVSAHYTDEQILAQAKNAIEIDTGRGPGAW